MCTSSQQITVEHIQGLQIASRETWSRVFCLIDYLANPLSSAVDRHCCTTETKCEFSKAAAKSKCHLNCMSSREKAGLTGNSFLVVQLLID